MVKWFAHLPPLNFPSSLGPNPSVDSSENTAASFLRGDGMNKKHPPNSSAGGGGHDGMLWAHTSRQQCLQLLWSSRPQRCTRLVYLHSSADSSKGHTSSRSARKQLQPTGYSNRRKRVGGDTVSSPRYPPPRETEGPVNLQRGVRGLSINQRYKKVISTHHIERNYCS